MHKFDPSHIERLLSEQREKDLCPERLLRDAGLKEGDALADVGCGPGFFSIPAAGIVGPTGKVYAIDSQDEMLLSLRKRNPPPSVIPVRSEENSIPLEGESAQFVLLAYVLHEAGQKPVFLAEIKRILKKGGRLLVLDWKRIAEEHGPPLEERISEAEASALLEDAGFMQVRHSSLNRSQYRISGIKTS